MNEPISTPGSSGLPLADDQASGDPVSWLQIQQGWTVVSSDGALAGTVAQVEGDKNDDIFDGLAVASSGGSTSYVPAERVGTIFPGRVTLTIGAAEVAVLEPFRPAAPETRWTVGKPPLSQRLSRWFRGGH